MIYLGACWVSFSFQDESDDNSSGTNLKQSAAFFRKNKMLVHLMVTTE
uniref:Uncharacterized protein n=1 Tax=Arundo donax TaxID=35708 RepID=A0A0A9BD60_ARUDO